MVKVTLQKEAINTQAALAGAGTDADGAILAFIGRARNFSQGREVLRLEYEVYEPMAKKELEKIVGEAVARWKVTHCIVIHRYGTVGIGEPSILIAVSSPHRDAAFQAVRYIIDTVKKTVPIWKKEFFADGEVWVSERS